MAKYIRDGRAPIPANENISKSFSGNKGKNTKPELELRKALWASGLKGYRIHYTKAAGRPDISYVGEKIAIFVNGCYWHRCPYCKLKLPKSNVDFWKDKFEKNKDRDKKKTKALKDKGWRVLTIWECQIKKDITKCVNKIRKLK